MPVDWDYRSTLDITIIEYLLTVTIMKVAYERVPNYYRITPEPYYNTWKLYKNNFSTPIRLTKEDAQNLLPRCSTKQAKSSLTRFILEVS
jgi:hypothetical protein